MNLSQNFYMCPYLSGNDEGLYCKGCSLHVRNINDIDLEICLSKHYESCYIYFTALQNTVESEITGFLLKDILQAQESIPLLPN